MLEATELLSVCAVCKRTPQEGLWTAIEDLHLRPKQSITHAICPECGKKLYPRYAEPRDGE